MEREYDWDVHHRGSGKGMTESFFFTLRNGAVHYNELETRVKLLRRKLTGTTKVSTNFLEVMPGHIGIHPPVKMSFVSKVAGQCARAVTRHLSLE